MAGTSAAQPTLSATGCNPVPGDRFFYYYAAPAAIDNGAAGAGITWDYTSLVPTVTDTIDVLNCASTPYCDSFSGDIVEYYHPDSIYVYMTESSSSLKDVGDYVPVGSGGPGMVHYYTPTVMGHYPATYGTNWFDTTYYRIGDPGSTSEYRMRLARHSTADGYGTLKTPAGTFTNALRIHVHEYGFDTMYYYMTTGIDTIDHYVWYAPGIHCPLLSITQNATSIHGGDPAVYYWKPMPATAVPVAEAAGSNYTVFPNPAAATLNIRNGTADWTTEKVQLLDISGRVVWEWRQEPASGDVLQVNLATVDDGLYLLSISSATGTQVQKVLVSKR